MTFSGRREWLKTIASASLGAVGSEFVGRANAQSKGAETPFAKRSQPLALKDYQPKSMLHVPETLVPRSRFPVIDFHTHLSWTDRKGKADVVRHTATPTEVLQVMDAKNVRIMVNLTGGYGALLDETLRHWQQPHPDRFLVFTEPLVCQDQAAELFEIPGGSTTRSQESRSSWIEGS